MSNILIDLKKQHLEQDRLDILHDIVFYAKLEQWDRVKKLKDLYHSIYGNLPGEKK